MDLRAQPPAKLNLSLAVTGRRPDGFHELVSVVAPIDLRDELSLEPGGASDVLLCDDTSVPVDGRNLVLRAAEAYRSRVPEAPFGQWTLAKRIPHGAGLGGGSSDAAAALTLLNRASPVSLDEAGLSAVAAEVGSDCPLFLHPRGSVIRGRGERIESLSGAVLAALSGRGLILAKPAWGVSTAEAYAWKARAGDYGSAEEAEAGLASALVSADPLRSLVDLGNDLEAAVGAHRPELMRGLSETRDRLGLVGRMTGSGSACFLLAEGDEDLDRLRSVLEESWGAGVWLARASLL